MFPNNFRQKLIKKWCQEPTLSPFCLKPRRSRNFSKRATAQVCLKWPIITTFSITLTKQRIWSCVGSFCRNSPCSSTSAQPGLAMQVAKTSSWASLGERFICLVNWNPGLKYLFFSNNRGPWGEDVKAKGENSVLLCVQAGAQVPTEADWLLCSSTSVFWVQSESDVNWYPVPEDRKENALHLLPLPSSQARASSPFAVLQVSSSREMAPK